VLRRICAPWGGRARSVAHHTTPLSWEHIGLSGDFLWDHAAATADNHRSLNVGRVRAAAGLLSFLVRSSLAQLMLCSLVALEVVIWQIDQ
jgi:hypothetical protein